MAWWWKRARHSASSRRPPKNARARSSGKSGDTDALGARHSVARSSLQERKDAPRSGAPPAMNRWDAFVDTFFNARVMAKYLPDILWGVVVTVELAVLVVITGLAAGLALAL